MTKLSPLVNLELKAANLVVSRMMNGQSEPVLSVAKDCFTGGGQMGELMRFIDWSKTPIGAVESWSLALRMMVSFLLVNRFPMLLWAGPNFCQIYNDPYRMVLGRKHPGSLLYLLAGDRKQAHLAGAAGIETGKAESTIEV